MGPSGNLQLSRGPKHNSRPDRADDEIDIDYHCDQFIDCQNFSDESVDCGSNYLVLFIVFGVLTGLLILGTFPLFVFTVVFGFLVKRRRIRAASPPFLIVLVSTVIGYASVCAWFGKPHLVGFFPLPLWLLHSLCDASAFTESSNSH